MLKLEKAKKFVEKFPFTTRHIQNMAEFKELNECEYYYDGKNTCELEVVNSKVLAQSLSYVITVTVKIGKDKAVPLGASKQGGYPHLPKGFKTPAGYLFNAQLNIGDFKKWDIENYFPAKGMIYLFEAEDDAEEVKVLFYDGPVSALEVNKAVEVSSADYCSRFSFKPCYLFNFGMPMDTFFLKEAAKLVPAPLKAQLNKALGCTITGDNSHWQIFGRPSYWQSEDMEGDKSHAASRLLMFQESHGEGNRHYWIRPADLKAKKFNKTIVTYSGT